MGVDGQKQMEPFKKDCAALGMSMAVLRSRKNVAQSYLFLSRTQQNSDVPGMEALGHPEVAA